MLMCVCRILIKITYLLTYTLKSGESALEITYVKLLWFWVPPHTSRSAQLLLVKISGSPQRLPLLPGIPRRRGMLGRSLAACPRRVDATPSRRPRPSRPCTAGMSSAFPPYYCGRRRRLAAIRGTGRLYTCRHGALSRRCIGDDETA